MENKKITLKQFFENSGLAIHCKTEDQADKLLEQLNEMEKELGDKRRYVIFNQWYELFNRWWIAKEKTCIASIGIITTKKLAIENFGKSNVYEFEDVIF